MPPREPAPRALLDDARTAELRTALAGYTVDGLAGLLGPVGSAALARGDRAGTQRELRAADDRRLADLVRMFLLGQEIDDADARRALDPLPVADAVGAGLVETSAGSTRARLDLRPYAEDGAGGAPWWVVSDFGSDVRPGPLSPDHVLGIGAAALTLAQATPRLPVGRALDVGTGCGVQALHLHRHAGAVTATDVSPRALRLAATTAALSGQRWDLRVGSWLEPVVGESFDLIVANPPFVVSDGSGGYDYRDSGLAGDEVSRLLVSGLPGRLSPGGTAQLLANWIVPTEGDWRDRVSGWVAGRGCDAWVWQREIADLREYVTLWLRDAGEVPGSRRWTQRYDAWLDWFESHGVAAVGMGLVTMWRTDAAEPTLVLEDVPQAVAQPVGAALPGWLARRRWLAAATDDALWAEPLRACTDLVRERRDLLGDAGWATAQAVLRQSHELRWQVEVDDAVASLVAACDGTAPVGFAREVLAASLGLDDTDLARALAPVVRDLVGRGMLLPRSAPNTAAASAPDTAGAR